MLHVRNEWRDIKHRKFSHALKSDSISKESPLKFEGNAKQRKTGNKIKEQRETLE